MANVSVPSNLGGIYDGASGTPAGNTSGGTTTAGTETPKLATAQTPTPTTGPGFVSAGMNAAGVPDYISNWLASGGTGVNPADPNVADAPGAETMQAFTGSADPGVQNNVFMSKLGVPGRAAKVRPAAPPAAPGTVQAPAMSSSIQRAANAVNGATPGAPGATPGAPAATGASIYDPRFGTAPTINSKVNGLYGVTGAEGLPGNFAAPTTQELEAITDEQLTNWLKAGGGQPGTSARLGPEQQWIRQGKYADPGSLRSYALWRLGMTNGMAAAGQYKAPTPVQPVNGYGR